MHASTKGSLISPMLEDDKPTTIETRPLENEKLEIKAPRKETSRAIVAKRPNRALLVLVITMCLISLVAFLLTLLMLFGKIGNRCGCPVDEGTKASSSSSKGLASYFAKMKSLEEIITSLQLGLMEHCDVLEEFNNTLIKMEYLGAELTGLKSVLNRTSAEIAELKDTQTKEKVIYHQIMTPSWLEAHASYISSNRSNTTEQLTFNAGSKDETALLKVSMIPANILQNSTMLTVRIVVSNDVSIGTYEDSDIAYGVSDEISFVGFWAFDNGNYVVDDPCVGTEGSSGTTLTSYVFIDRRPQKTKQSLYPGQFVITLKLDSRESWGSCYTAHDAGLVRTTSYSKRLVLSKGLTLEVYRDDREERYGIKFIEVTVVDDL